jgi:hypothetical protein
MKAKLSHPLFFLLPLGWQAPPEGTLGFFRSKTGKAALLLVVLGVPFAFRHWPMTLGMYLGGFVLPLALSLLFPGKRAGILAVASFVTVAFFPGHVEKELRFLSESPSAQWIPHAFLAILACAILRAWYFSRFAPAVFRSYPQFVLILSYAGAVVVFGAHLHALAFLVLLLTPLWYLCCELLSGARHEESPGLRYHPFWSVHKNFHFPVPAGMAAIKASESEGEDALLFTRLKGARLLLWALAIDLAFSLVSYVGQEILRIPTVPEALRLVGQGAELGWQQSWKIIVLNFLGFLFHFSIAGHIVVGIARFAGYRLPRQVYRPFAAVTVGEFFQRIAYYYKEFLALLFFYPAYLTFFRRHPRARLFAALMLSAGFGNFLVCYLRDISYFLRFGLVESLRMYLPHIFFCSVLGVGIFVSELLVTGETRKRLRENLFLRAIAQAKILFFFSLLYLFHDLYVGDISLNFRLLCMAFSF